MATDTLPSDPAGTANNWTMPEIRPGANVMWFKSGRKDGHGEMALVLGKSRSNRHLKVMCHVTGMVYEAVRHHADPRIKENPESAEDGVWDYTEEHVALRQLREDVDRLTELLNSSGIPQARSSRTAPKVG